MQAAVAALALLAGVALAPQDGPSAPVRALDAAFAELAALDTWPGFDARGTPLFVFDGTDTWLLGHPTPPPEFERVVERAALFRGRHAEARANTSIELGGVWCGAMQLDPEGDARRSAAVMLHEVFHVWQGAHRPEWTANEAELFTYPADDARLLALRRRESDALRRALAAKSDAQRDAWSAAACEARAQRFAELPEGAGAYERGVELKEGLAQYVQYRALEGAARVPPIPERGFAPADVRQRGYAIGEAWGVLLDRAGADWRARVVGDATPASLLAASLEERGVRAATWSENELASLETRARADAVALSAERQRLCAEVESAAGWRVEIEGGPSPLWPQGFDPLNVRALGDGVILHERWIRLADGADELEVLDRRALTYAAGEHPLWNGVRRVLVTGLTTEPEVERDGDALILRAAGLTARFEHASVSRGERALRITRAAR